MSEAMLTLDNVTRTYGGVPARGGPRRCRRSQHPRDHLIRERAPVAAPRASHRCGPAGGCPDRPDRHPTVQGYRLPRGRVTWEREGKPVGALTGPEVMSRSFTPRLQRRRARRPNALPTWRPGTSLWFPPTAAWHRRPRPCAPGLADPSCLPQKRAAATDTHSSEFRPRTAVPFQKGQQESL